MASTESAIEAITVEALTMDGNVVGVQVSLFGVPVHYASKSTTASVNPEENLIGPCEMWLHWGHESGRIVTRALDAQPTALPS